MIPISRFIPRGGAAERQSVQADQGGSFSESLPSSSACRGAGRGIATQAKSQGIQSLTALASAAKDL